MKARTREHALENPVAASSLAFLLATLLIVVSDAFEFPHIIAGLLGVSGHGPHYVIDAPGGGGKIPLLPEYVVGREGDDVILRNYEGKLYRYHDRNGNDRN